jgi:uncharacterized membrane protein
MSSIPSEPSAAEVAAPSRSIFKKLLHSHWTFAVLQGLDLLTTMVAFRMGAFEVNPLVAHLTVTFGRFRGVLISKLIAIGIAMGVRRLIWIVNLFYAAIILWNSINMLAGR